MCRPGVGSSGRSASPEVDQAPCARLSEFYQDHVDGKFRHAEAVVAEETKDYFYSTSKPRYLSYEIEEKVAGSRTRGASVAAFARGRRIRSLPV